MSKLFDLICELCPNGVEYKRFDEACTLHARIGWQRLTRAEYCTKGNHMLVTGTDFTNTYTVDYSRCVFVSEDRYNQDPKIQLKNGDILITKDGTLGKVAQIDNLPMPATLNGGVFVVRSKDGSLENRFILHFLLSGHFKQVVEQQKTGSTISHLTQALFSRIRIPVPPLEVQREIVRILDSFTLITAELTAELTARKQQYEYYTNRLLSFENIKYYSLEEICDIVDYRGKTPKKSDSGIFLVTAKNIRKGYIDYDKSQEYIPEDTYEEVMHRGYPQIGDVLITTEAPCGFVAQVDRDDIALAQRVIKYRPKDTSLLDSTYLKYILLGNEFQNELERQSTGGTVKGIKGSRLHKMQIPVPDIETQLKIVKYLDRFDSLIHSLKDGLPAEIEARNKQYEYYRDKLLSFEELTT